MTVETFNPERLSPDQIRIDVTPEAGRHIQAQIARSGEQHIRLSVEESGCNGYRYALNYISEPADQDRALAGQDDWRLFVRESDLAFVNGTTIELEVNGLNQSLRFKNPNADSHCGCGESFSVS
jgi:iron-sulfur cluster assembly accessory protein